MRIIVLFCVIPAVCCEFTLNILHLNDFHARFEETNIYSGRCGEAAKAANKCYGGFARVQSKVSELRDSLENTLFLAGGDYFQGTVWYSVHKWKALAYFLNIINHDAMVLGNHEFDDGIAGVVPFLENVTFPVIVANIDDSLEPTFQGKVHPSLVRTLAGVKVGIIGYLTVETEFIANPGKLKFLNEVDSVRKEAQRMKSEGVDIIIALGHAGFQTDKDIAANVEEVDIVVGGHTNTFLYKGDDPSTEPAVGEYPEVITQASGRKVLVVQAYAFGKYLGHLQATFDDEGEVLSWNGNPILLDNSVSQDETILNELVPWRVEINKIVTETIGRSFVFLNGSRLSCRMRECNLGNLEADAIVHQSVKYPDGMEWAQISLAVVNGGSIRASIDERASNGSISIEDVLVVAPFQNTIDIVELKGKHVKEMFEASVNEYDESGINAPGRFLQVSGFHVVFNLRNPVGSRVVTLEARCVSCRVPALLPVEDDELYKIAMPSYIANGGDGFPVIRENKVNHHLSGLLDSDVYSQYIRLYSPIYQGVENRIQFIDENDQTACGKVILETTEYRVESSNSNVNELSLLMAIVLSIGCTISTAI